MDEVDDLAALLAANEARCADRQAALDAIVVHPAELGERGRAWLQWLTAPDYSYHRGSECPPDLPCPDDWEGEPKDLPADHYFAVPHYAYPETTMSWQLTQVGKAAWEEARGA